jgi:amidase
MRGELWSRSATDLAELIQKKEVSSVEVVESHLRRIEAVNPSVNAITVVLGESALEAARIADANPGTGPLHGVPFTVKENIDCTGSATTQGVPALAEAMPPRDAPVVERMKAAGAIPIARTNLPEFGLRISTSNPLRGRTLNPWDPTRVAGGSSGGEASSLATGMSPIGLGNDIGGSLRNPAYCCGVIGLKPTTGRIPHASSLPPEDPGLAEQLMGVEGPMARHVKDVRLG